MPPADPLDTIRRRVVIVCGGREFTDRERIYTALDALHAHLPFTGVVTGGASGADTIAAAWAEERGVESTVYYADWKHHGRKAGPIRNQSMIDEEKPDMLVWFPGGPGTRDMVRRAAKAGIFTVNR